MREPVFIIGFIIRIRLRRSFLLHNTVMFLRLIFSKRTVNRDILKNQNYTTRLGIKKQLNVN